MHVSGIVRPARRPPGWIAPGPAPAIPADRPDAWPRAGEDLCYLSGDWRILQRVDGHRWSLDDLVTAWFAAQQLDAPPRCILDLGCGIGAVLLLLAWCFPQARVVGIEAQALSAALAMRSLRWNGVAERCAIRAADLRDPASCPEGAVYDLVTGTPPYLPRGTATEPRRVQQAGCHIEHRGGIDAYCAAAARSLRPFGTFVCCHAAAQHARVEHAAGAAGLAIVAYRAVIPRAGKPALFAVHSMRRAGERTAAIRILPPLVVRDAHGQRTGEFRRLRAEMGMPP